MVASKVAAMSYLTLMVWSGYNQDVLMAKRYSVVRILHRREGTNIVSGENTELPHGLASIHTHSHYCDGHGEIEEYIWAAIDANLSAFGASGHSPLPYPCEWAMTIANYHVYAREVRSLARKYADRIPVLLGLELDYHPGMGEFYRREIFSKGLDYVVASVHFVGTTVAQEWSYDESAQTFDAQIRRAYLGDARPVVEDYYRRLQKMVGEAGAWDLPVVVGHLDRIVLWNRGDRYFPTDNGWYQGLVDDSIGAIARSKCILEINTSGWDKACEMSNPNATILGRAAEAGLPVIVSADAHYPGNVAAHYRRALDVLKTTGFTELVLPSCGAWSPVPLPTG